MQNIARNNISSMRRAAHDVLGATYIKIIMCLLAGVVLPSIIFFHGNISAQLNNPMALNSSLAASLAIISGTLVIRRLDEFPGTITARYIVPSFVATFSIAIAVILLARVPYSGQFISIAFAGSIVAHFFVNAIERRRDRIRYFLVPGGKIGHILDDLGNDAEMLDKPMLPEQPEAIMIADLHHDHSSEWERAFALAALTGIGVYHYKQVWEARTGMVRIEHLSENSLGSLIPNNSWADVKRVVDITITLIILPLVFLPLLITAIVIKCDSPGPIFFRQARVGYRGRQFDVLKFRTMRVAKPATDLVDEAITKDDDDRITRVGRFLRQTRIDELPQIYNILRGEMSWIGPRPEAMPLSEWYEREIPFYIYRHIVRPGITGWAQVNQGHVAGISEVHDKLRYDFYYIKNFSLWIDILISFKTVLVVIRGIGAK